MQLQAFTMSLYCFHHGHRPLSECGPYCLDVNDISPPRYASSYDSQGIPMFLQVFYRNWKHHPTSERGDPYMQQFCAHRKSRNV